MHQEPPNLIDVRDIVHSMRTRNVASRPSVPMGHHSGRSETHRHTMFCVKTLNTHFCGMNNQGWHKVSGAFLTNLRERTSQTFDGRLGVFSRLGLVDFCGLKERCNLKVHFGL